MASDHRGRALHAGKRTAQEMGWTAIAGDRKNPFPEDIYFHAGKTAERDEAFGMYVNHQPDTLLGGGGYTDRDKWATALTRKRNDMYSNDYTWAVHSQAPEGMPDEEALGQGKTAYAIELQGKKYRSIVGRTSTPTRAMIAAEGMKKRIEEGRDLKTGRPKE